METEIAVKANTKLKWSVAGAAAQFGVSRDTLSRKLRSSGVEPSQYYSSREVLKALFPDVAAERERRLRTDSDYVQLKTQILRGSYLEKSALTQAIQSVFLAVAQIINGNVKLTPEERAEIHQNLASINIRIDEVQKAQTHGAITEEPPGRPRKVEADAD